MVEKEIAVTSNIPTEIELSKRLKISFVLLLVVKRVFGSLSDYSIFKEMSFHCFIPVFFFLLVIVFWLFVSLHPALHLGPLSFHRTVTDMPRAPNPK